MVIPVLYGPRILSGYKGWQPYTVKPGDTLTKIAQAHYGNTIYQPIFEANQHLLSNPNVIIPGQVLRVPRNDLDCAPGRRALPASSHVHVIASVVQITQPKPVPG